jgi:Phage integrase, N-terminal SAM-like domain
MLRSQVRFLLAPPGQRHFGPDPATGKPRQAARTFTGSERAASKALSALVAEVKAGKFKRTTETVRQLLDMGLEFASQRQRTRTVYENRSKINSRIQPILGKVTLDKLEPGRLDGAYRM